MRSSWICFGFQAAEIESAHLEQGGDVHLDEDYRRAQNSARLAQLCQEVLAQLSEEDSSIITRTGQIGRAISELVRLDSSAGPIQILHEQCNALLRDLSVELSGYSEKIDLDFQRLAELETRMNAINLLKRKYGSTLEEVIAFGENAREKLNQLENREQEVARLGNEIRAVEKELWADGMELSRLRQKAIPTLQQAVQRQLKDLGFKQSHFDVSLSSLAAGSSKDASNVGLHGLDTIEFEFAPNPGEPPRPLRAIASSGEMARVMLALKTVLAVEDEVPVLVFDEVDANVGGETAPVVGRKMRKIGERRQVLCITHLAPVAASAAEHYVVSKQTQGGRTVTHIELLGEDQRIQELARMLGGQSSASIHHAEELLKAARK